MCGVPSARYLLRLAPNRFEDLSVTEQHQLLHAKGSARRELVQRICTAPAVATMCGGDAVSVSSLQCLTHHAVPTCPTRSGVAGNRRRVQL